LENIPLRKNGLFRTTENGSSDKSKKEKTKRRDSPDTGPRKTKMQKCVVKGRRGGFVSKVRVHSDELEKKNGDSMVHTPKSADLRVSPNYHRKKTKKGRWPSRKYEPKKEGKGRHTFFKVEMM